MTKNEAVLRIGLVSDDTDLLNSCLNVLNACAGIQFEVWSASPKDSRLPGADILFYDAAAGPLPETVLQETGAHSWLLAVYPEQIAAVRLQVPGQNAQFVTKPIWTPLLQAMIEHLIAGCQKQTTGPLPRTGEISASEQDHLLQLLLMSQYRLQEAADKRSNLLARAAHDLHAPLNILNGYCGLLLSRALGPLNQEQEHALDRVQNSVRRVSRLASSLSDLSANRLQSDPPVTGFGEFQKCIQQAVREVLPHLEEKNIALSVDLQETSAPLYLDFTQMQYALTILLENSCRYCPRHSLIEITGYPSTWAECSLSDEVRAQAAGGGAYRLDLRDAGPGYQAYAAVARHERSLAPEARVDRSGGGLGLVICRLIVEQHGGYLHEQPAPEGGWVSLVLPLISSGDPVPSQPLVVPPVVSQEVEENPLCQETLRS